MVCDPCLSRPRPVIPCNHCQEARELVPLSFFPLLGMDRPFKRFITVLFSSLLPLPRPVEIVKADSRFMAAVYDSVFLLV